MSMHATNRPISTAQELAACAATGPKPTPEEQAAMRARFNAMVDKVVATAPVFKQAEAIVAARVGGPAGARRMIERAFNRGGFSALVPLLDRELDRRAAMKRDHRPRPTYTGSTLLDWRASTLGGGAGGPPDISITSTMPFTTPTTTSVAGVFLFKEVTTYA